MRVTSLREAMEQRKAGVVVVVDPKEWGEKKPTLRGIQEGEACSLWGQSALCVERVKASRIRAEGSASVVEEDEVVRFAVALPDGTLGEHTAWASDLQETAE